MQQYRTPRNKSRRPHGVLLGLDGRCLQRRRWGVRRTR